MNVNHLPSSNKNSLRWAKETQIDGALDSVQEQIPRLALGNNLVCVEQNGAVRQVFVEHQKVMTPKQHWRTPYQSKSQKHSHVQRNRQFIFTAAYILRRQLNPQEHIVLPKDGV